MRKSTEKMCSAAATTKHIKAETGTTCKTASAPETNSITPTAGCPQKISDYLMHGAENAVPRRHLETVTGLDGRTVRAMITYERLHGTPILSDSVHGYYLPADEGEKACFVRSMRRRAGEILRAAKAVERGGRLIE